MVNSTDKTPDVLASPESHAPDYTKNFDDVLIAEHLQIADRRDHLGLPGGKELRQAAQAARRTRLKPFAMWQKAHATWLSKREAQRGEEPLEQPVYSASGVHPTMGLALSGGGIRSAAFCLGAMQALSVKNLLPRFDYVSSVSGGGYSGIAATLAVSANGGEFPFADGSDDVRDTRDMQLFRNNVNYLKFGMFKSMLKNLAIVCKGVATNIVLTIAALLLLAAFSLWANPTILSLSIAGLDGLEAEGLKQIIPPGLRDQPFGISVMIILAGFFISMWWAVQAGVRGTFENFKSNLLVLSSVWLMISAASVFFELQPVLVKQMISVQELKIASALEQCLTPLPAKLPVRIASQEEQERCWNVADFAVSKQARLEQAASSKKATSKDGSVEATAVAEASAKESSGFKRLIEWLQALLAPALAFVALASRYVGDLLKAGSEGEGWAPTFKRFIGRSIVWAAGLALPVVLWVAYLGLFYWGVVVVNAGTATAIFAPDALVWVTQSVTTESAPYAIALLYVAVATGLIFAWILASLFYPNANSLHGLYRGRLGEAFCVPWAKEHSLEMKLSQINTRQAPVHLINTALNIQASKSVNERGRNADFFAFSNAYVGSAATGYAATPCYEKVERQLDVSSAMAISGAAASSNMGAQSIRPLTFTLALLNIRLGAWLSNPMIGNGGIWKDPLGFLDELTGRLKEDRRMIYLTDGGHIENLGIYELLRRRCKLIVAVDAEADREMNFSSFITLQRYARIDFGCRIEMDWKKIKKQSLAIQRGNAGAPAAKGGETVAPAKPDDGPHCAIGEITYEGGSKGLLLYIKSSLSGDENDYICDYNRRNYDFPHETTGDQNFSEEQFEVYRALGFHATHGAVSGKHSIEVSGGKLAKLSPKSSAPQLVKEVRKHLQPVTRT